MSAFWGLVRTGWRAAAFLFACLTFPVSASGQSLADALVGAYLNSPELAEARAKVKVFAERAVQARAGGLPTIEGQADLSLLGQSDDGEGVRFPNSVRLLGTQPLYTGGQVENATEAAEKRISARTAELLATEQQVLLDAVVAFMNVRLREQLVGINENNVRVLSEQLRAARERFEVGEVTRTDVEQARARLAASRSALAAQRGALESAREVYRRVVGVYPQKLLPPPPLPDLPKSRDEAVAIALRNDPLIRAARLEREAAGSDVRAAIGALLPQVQLRAEVVRSDQDLNTAGFSSVQHSASVGLQVSIPFFTGGRNYSRVREAQAVVEQAAAGIDDAMRRAAENVAVAWSNLDVARASIRAGKLQVRAARLAFEGVSEEAKVGARTTLDVLNAEQEVLDARAALVSAQRDEYVAAYTLLAAMGMLTVEHLGLDVGPTADVGSYYEAVRSRNFGYDKTDDTVWRFDWRP